MGKTFDPTIREYDVSIEYCVDRSFDQDGR